MPYNINMISLFLSLLFLFLGVHYASADICAASCIQPWDGSKYSESGGCTTMRLCNRCDTAFYNSVPVAGVCQQSPTGIYNLTQLTSTDSNTVAGSTFLRTGTTASTTRDGYTCPILSGVGTA